MGGWSFKGAPLRNVTLKGYGATLKMRRDLFASGKPYQPSEHRHAIVFYASQNVKILGLTIKDGLSVTVDREITAAERLIDNSAL